MKQKIATLFLVLASLCVYLEWGGHQSTFLIWAEAEVFKKLVTNPADVLHPLILLPLAGQLMLIASIFTKTPRRWLTFSGLACLGLLPLFVFVIGLISLHYKIVLCSLPFMACAVHTILINRRQKPGA